jgi:hypothetical protein
MAAGMVAAVSTAVVEVGSTAAEAVARAQAVGADSAVDPMFHLFPAMVARVPQRSTLRAQAVNTLRGPRITMLDLAAIP